MIEKEFKELKVGDRIKALSDTWAKSKGVCGTVVRAEKCEIIVKWDENVDGWNDESLDITNKNGESISLNEGTNKYDLIVLNNNIYNLHITCEDGVNTTEVYSVNGKVVSTSKTKRNTKEDEFDFKTAVYNCINRLDNLKPTKGKDLIGQEIKKGQKVRIINVEPHRRNDRVCLDEYIGKTGTFDYNYFTFSPNGFHSTITFDKEYMNAIDKENGCLCWRWDEVELLNDED